MSTSFPGFQVSWHAKICKDKFCLFIIQIYLLYNAQINVEAKQVFYQHLQRKGYSCIPVGALDQPEEERSLQTKLEGQDYSKSETGMHSNHDFAD